MTYKSALPPNFWLQQGNGPSATPEADIATLESEFGIRIPELLIEMWRTNPGHGKPRNRHVYWEPGEQVEPWFNGILGVVFQNDAKMCCYLTRQIFCNFKERRLIKDNAEQFCGLLVIGSVENGDEFWCLDYRESGNVGSPVVVCFAFEGGGKVQAVSESLEEFLRRLKRYDSEDCISLEWSQSGAELWQRLVTGLSLDDRTKGDSFFGGHREWRSTADSKLSPSYAGFSIVRNSEEWAEPFVEEPVDRWILRHNAHPRYRPEIHKRLDQLGLNWKAVFELKEQ